MRGAAVLMVLVWHYLNNTSVLRTPALSFLQDATSLLFFGVDLFFVISGFLIGLSLMQTRGDRGWIRGYLLRRAARILPLYYVWLAIYAAMLTINPTSGAFPWLLDPQGMPLWSYATFTQNFASARLHTWGPAWLGVTWTLAIEVHFYILAAVLIAIVPPRALGLAALAIIAASAYGKTLWGVNHAEMVLTPTRLDSPFVGVLAARIWRHINTGWPHRYAVAARLFAVALMTAHYFNEVYGPIVRLPLPSLTANALVFGVAVLCFAGGAGPTANVAVRFLRWCGVRCYAIYLFHVGVLGLVSHALFNWPPNVFPPGVGWPAVVIATAGTFALALASWRYFEKPIIVWAAKRAAASPSIAHAAPSIPRSRTWCGRSKS